MNRESAKPRIRPITDRELPQIPKLWLEAGLPYRPSGRDAVAKLVMQRRAAPDLFIGAFSRDRLVGVVIASDDGRKGWINRLAVHPSVRREGVGLALVKASEDALRKRGRHLFCVLIEKGKPHSEEFFAEAGYKYEEDILYYTKRERESF